MKKIVISAVNIRKGGTLTILRDCLEFLSCWGIENDYKIYALVHDKKLAEYDNINYIEIPWSIKTWGHRLWCEYVTMYSISKKIGDIALWLSLHDTTPNVIAKRQAVYCQTSFPFFKWKWQDFKFDYKIPLFSLFTKYAYKINIHKNDYLIVQQQWLKEGFSKLLNVDTNKFIIAPPERKKIDNVAHQNETLIQIGIKNFLYVSTPDCHKNFETVCKAAELLEQKIGNDKFTVKITVKGDENKYAKWLYKNWEHVKSIRFVGFLNKEALHKAYLETDCLIFASRIETWGLPISEFTSYNKPMLLADLPYAHETSHNYKNKIFFNCESYKELETKMKSLIDRGQSDIKTISYNNTNEDSNIHSWHELFTTILE